MTRYLFVMEFQCNDNINTQELIDSEVIMHLKDKQYGFKRLVKENDF